MPTKKKGPSTLVGHLGRSPHKWMGAVNTPIFRASTILFPTVEELKLAAVRKHPGLSYGLHGVPTVTDFQDAMSALEGGHAALAVPSGLTATTLPFLAFLKPGDHALVTDVVYGPTRRFCDLHVKRLGVEVEYYDPLIGADIAARMKPNTRLVFLDDTNLTLGPDSSVVLDRFVFDPDPSQASFVMTATKGIFRFASGKLPKNAYRLNTPAATIGIRGTLLTFSVDPAGGDRGETVVSIALEEGQAVIDTCRGESLILNAGQSVELARDPAEACTPP